MSRALQLEGRTLGDFQIRAHLGSGGFGLVYAASQASLGRDAVIKVMSPGARARPADVERFLREARIAAALDHPYAAHVYAFGAEADGLLWIAMERVGGTPLDQVLTAQGPMPLGRFVPFFERVCEVVHHAHERGVVHRDLKPANIMVLARSGRLLPKLLDFGIAGFAGTVEPRAEADDRDDDRAVGPLTEAGPLGSPHYMAPEQWVSAHDATAASDLYALAVLAYEALTGRRPFVGATVRELARAHARGTAAPLGGELPVALDEVLARCWRRAPAERPASALELASAIRRAAGQVDAAPRPRLPDALRAELLVTAPTPIADAVAALDAAGPLHAREATAVLARALLRYLVLVAAAGAGQLAGDPAAVLAEVLALDRRSDRAWLELGRHLVAGHAAHPEAFPIPEVVIALGASADAAAHPLALALGDGDLEAITAATAEALTAARGVLAYQLVVRAGASAERWTGLGRDRRVAAAIAGLDRDGATLVDRDGAPRVALAPWIVPRIPAVGVTEALFFLDGRDAAGARFVAWPTGYEHRDAALVPAAAADAPAGDEQAPFVGLASFTAADADRYVGREPQIEAVLNRLRAQPMIAVVGPSGVGKTSFVQAGVLPRLPTGWRALTVRPGGAPLDGLAARLAELTGAAREPLRARLSADPDALSASLIAAAGAGVIVLVVEQLEELITLASDDDRRAMVAALARAATTIDLPVRVLVTLRDDFLVRAQELGPLWTRFVAGLELLTTPAPADLIRVLTAPVARAGYRFDDPTLAADMVAAVAGQAGALPLLQFTAARLWELRDRADRTLTRAAYDRLGGVAGALAGHADAVLEHLPADDRRLVRATFRQLVTAEGTRAIVARGDLERLLASPRAGAVVEQLIAARLLVAREGDDGDDQLEIIHEALLAAWPRLVAWRREDAEGLWLRDQLRVAARQWDRRDRDDGLLWRGDALVDLERWRARQGGALGAVEDAFAAASVALEAGGRRRRRALYAAALIVLTGATAALLVIAQQARRARTAAEDSRAIAETSRQAAEDRTTQLYVEEGRRALLADDGQTAYVYLREATRRGAGDLAIATMLARAGRLVAAELAAAQASAPVKVAAWRPDGAMVATAGDDGAIELWSPALGRVATLRGHQGPVYLLAWTPDGQRLVSAGRESLPRLWEPARGALIAELRGHRQSDDHETRALVVSRDGRTIASADKHGEIRLWSARDGAPGPVFQHAAGEVDLGFRPDGALVVADTEGVAIWELGSSPRVRARHREPTGAIRCVAITASGALIATATAGPVRVLDGATAAVQRTLDDHAWSRCPAVEGDDIVTVGAAGELRAWTVAGQRRWDSAPGLDVSALTLGRQVVIAGSVGGHLQVWDRATGRVIVGHAAVRQKLWSLEVSPDQASVLVTGIGGALQLYPTHGIDELTRTPDPAAELELVDGAVISLGTGGLRRGATTVAGPLQDGSVDPRGRALLLGVDGAVRISEPDGTLGGGPVLAGASAVALSGDGRRAAIALADRTIAVYQVDGWRRLATLPGHDAPISTVSFDPTGRWLGSGDSAGDLRIWSIDPARLISRLVGHAGPVHKVRLPDEAHVISTGSDRTLRLWNRSDGSARVATEHDGEVFAVDVAPDGRIATGGDGGVYLWSADGRLLTRPLRAGRVFSVAWDRSGARLAAAVDLAEVVALDVAAGPPDDATLDCRLRVAIGADGRPVERTPSRCP